MLHSHALFDLIFNLFAALRARIRMQFNCVGAACSSPFSARCIAPYHRVVVLSSSLTTSSSLVQYHHRHHYRRIRFSYRSFCVCVSARSFAVKCTHSGAHERTFPMIFSQSQERRRRRRLVSSRPPCSNVHEIIATASVCGVCKMHASYNRTQRRIRRL